MTPKPAPLSVRLRLTTPIDGILAMLRQVAQRRPEFAKGILRALKRGDEFVSLKVDRAAAVGAGELIIRLDPSDRLRRLMSALGAGDSDRLLIERAFGHAKPPSSSENPTIGRNGEGA